jgi:hypothetical protein
MKRTHLNEKPDGQLHLEDKEERGRAGDRRSRKAEREEFPPERVRRAGLTAAETASPDQPTEDDANPETLIPEEKPQPMDQTLRVTDEASIGEGFGKDEAELAEEDPVGRPRQRPAAGHHRGPARVHSRNRQHHP